MSADFSRAAVLAIRTRDSNSCVRCRRGDPESLHTHHRQLKSRGGQGNVANGISLCPADHRWVHEHPAQATVEGLMVPSWRTASETPVTWWVPTAFGTLRKTQVLLADDGTFTEVREDKAA